MGRDETFDKVSMAAYEAARTSAESLALLEGAS
jgi:hypothetical protein